MKPFVKFLIVAALIAAPTAYYYVVQLRPDLIGGSTAPAPGGAGGGQAQGGFAVPVEAVKVKVSNLQRQIAAVGSLRSNESVIVRPEVAGRIAQILFNESQKVARGMALVTLDSTVLRAELAEARASLVLSQANHQRARELVEKGAGSARTRDEALAKLRADEARVQSAQARLDKMTITAPFEGVIGLRKVSVGDYVNAGQDMVNLEMIDPLKVDFRVPEIYLAAVAPGQPLRVGVDAFPGRAFDGAVYAIDPLIDQGGRSIVIRARLPNPDNVLRPGLFARVSLILNEKSDALLVPEQAIIAFGTDQFVFRVVDGKAAMTKVSLGIRRDAEVEILEGLKPGEVVVTAGHMKLRDGVPVQLTGAPQAGS
ncbi:MAG: efflux RND transporter periplasmic adaptor subunit [Alphaproteobacteria bacterium]|nr:efflux RND transporter periplasmic adaptor subunit [Alphaproteobacteria bacterium]